MKTPSDRTRLIAGATRRGGGRGPSIRRSSAPRPCSATAPPTCATKAWARPTAGRKQRRPRTARHRSPGLEGADEAWIVPSGLAAVTVPLAGRREARRRDHRLRRRLWPQPPFPDAVDERAGRHGAVPRAPRPTPTTVAALIGGHTRAVLIESPASLTMEMLDAPALAAAAGERRAHASWTTPGARVWPSSRWPTASTSASRR
jgi:cystathionine beta-lyase